MKFVKLNDNDLINLDLVEEIEKVKDGCLVWFQNRKTAKKLNTAEALRLIQMLPVLQPEGVYIL